MWITEVPLWLGPAPNGSLKVIGKPIGKAQYRWNLFRWLLQKPLYWRVTYCLEMKESNLEE